MRAPLCSWGFLFGVGTSNVFRGGSEVIWVNVGSYVPNVFRIFPILFWYWWSPLLMQVCGFCLNALVKLSSFSSSGSLWLLFQGDWPWVSLWKGLWIFWRYWLLIPSDVLGILLPAFWYGCTLTKKVLQGGLPFSLTVFIFCCSLSSFLVWVGHI